MQLWVDLIQHYARTFAEPWRTDDPFARRVADDGAGYSTPQDWPVGKLAAVVGMSAKQFTRLCQRSLGRTPAQHVTALRLQRAVKLLTTTDHKVEFIAHEVGYQ